MSFNFLSFVLSFLFELCFDDSTSLPQELLRPETDLDPRLVLMDRMLSSTPASSESAPRGELEALMRKWSDLVELATGCTALWSDLFS